MEQFEDLCIWQELFGKGRLHLSRGPESGNTIPDTYEDSKAVPGNKRRARRKSGKREQCNAKQIKLAEQRNLHPNHS